MHIFFSGIGGTGIGPLALIAKQAGFTVSGSDKQHSDYIAYLQKQGIKNITIGQTQESIENLHREQPIDWYVFSSAVAIENPNAPELVFCKNAGIKTSKRDDLLNYIITEKQLKMLAIAGTHGKTTTTAMLIWLCKQLALPISYSVGAKLSFGEMGQFDDKSRYFIYEADEFDKNFLAFHPYLSIITGIAWDHPDIYPTRQDYQAAFKQFIEQSYQTIIWQSDNRAMHLSENQRLLEADEDDPKIKTIKLTGLVNRKNAWQVIQAVHLLTDAPIDELVNHMNRFPGLSRRFEKIAPNIYSDYAHTPEKIRGALQMAQEIAGDNFAVVYEGLHNTRQHFIKNQLQQLFNNVPEIYIVPSYLAREDPKLKILAPEDLATLIGNTAQVHPSALNQGLKQNIEQRAKNGTLVLCLSAGGGGSLDEWLRKEFK